MNVYLQDFKEDMKKHFLEFQLVEGATFPDNQLAPSKFNVCRASGQLLISNTAEVLGRHLGRHLGYFTTLKNNKNMLVKFSKYNRC